MAHIIAKQGRHIAISHAVMRSADYISLSGSAVKALNALIFQFDGQNNGAFKATWAEMSKMHGFHSKNTLARALKELLNAKLIVKTRESSGGRCALYAVAWLPTTRPKKPSLAQLLGQVSPPSPQNPVRKKVSLHRLLRQLKLKHLPTLPNAQG